AARAQIFNANGTKSGSEFLMNTTTMGNQFVTSSAGLPDGRFVAVLQDESHTGNDTWGDAGHVQVFNADGSKTGAELLVNRTTTGDQDNARVSVLADGRFIVGWTDSSGIGDADGGVRGQIFDERDAPVVLSGTALNDEFVGTSFNDTLNGAGGNDT